MRKSKEIIQIEAELADKLWYNRHQLWVEKVETGQFVIVEEHNKVLTHNNSFKKDIWDGACKAAKEMEEKYGEKNLGPYSDFEWGMLNGKLSALRWFMGEEWDMLDS